MLVLISKSGGGKTTIENYLINHCDFNRAISHTTRPIRVSDVNGYNYFFVSQEEMDKLESDGQLAEKIVYLGNTYALTKEQCKDDRVVSVVPDGLKQLLTHDDLNLFSVYLFVDRETRRDRMLGRGDKLEDVEKRLLNDDDVFDGIEDLVDVVIDNTNKSLEEVVEEILKLYNNR